MKHPTPPRPRRDPSNPPQSNAQPRQPKPKRVKYKGRPTFIVDDIVDFH